MRDGKLQKLRQIYDDRRSDIQQGFIQKILESLEDDIKFLQKYLQKTVKKYKKKFAKDSSNNKGLKEMNWDIVEMTKLLESCQAFMNQYEKGDRVHAGLREELFTYTRDLFKKKRTAATHVLVIMVSDERRNSKPYALPVQYVPYKSLKDATVQRLVEDVMKAMRDLDMKYVGKLSLKSTIT